MFIIILFIIMLVIIVIFSTLYLISLLFTQKKINFACLFLIFYGKYKKQVQNKTSATTTNKNNFFFFCLFMWQYNGKLVTPKKKKIIWFNKTENSKAKQKKTKIHCVFSCVHFFFFLSINTKNNRSGISEIIFF
jgi:hypothetical protein